MKSSPRALTIALATLVAGAAFALPGAVSASASLPSAVSATVSPSSEHKDSEQKDTESKPAILRDWAARSSVSSETMVPQAAPVPKGAQQSPSAVTVKPLSGGKRITHRRGTALLWTENTLEWYWNSTKITSSTGWQQVGYIFPNVAHKDGISRTYKSNSNHNWRGTASAGAGIVSPWGNVDVFTTSLTDYYVLKRGGTYKVN